MAQEADRWQQDRRRRVEAAERSRGRWLIAGGWLMTLAGIALAVWALVALDLRANAGLALAAPIGGGLLMVGAGLRSLRSGSGAATTMPDWLAEAERSPGGEHFRLEATGTGIHESWILDGTRLTDRKGEVHDLSQLRGARVLERDLPAGWQAELTLLFPDAKTKIRAYERRPGPNRRRYMELRDGIHAIMILHDPNAAFTDAGTRMTIYGILGAVVAVGLVVGGVYVATLFG